MQQLAIGYVRVSADKQDVSLEVQQERIASYCGAIGLPLAMTISDNSQTASVPLLERSGGKALLDAIEAHKATAVVSLKLDRLWRSTIHCLEQVDKWESEGIALHLIDQGGASINTASSSGKLYITLLSGFATHERELISERTSAALQHKKANMIVYSATPFGFDREGKKLVHNANEQETIALIRELKANDTRVYHIAKHLNERGITTKRGCKWQSTTVNNVLEY